MLTYTNGRIGSGIAIGELQSVWGFFMFSAAGEA